MPIDQRAGHAVVHEVGRAGRLGRDDRQRASHRLQRHVAERLGDRGVEEDVGAGERAGKIGRRSAGRVKIASGSCCSNQARAGPSPMTSTRCLTPSAREGVDRVGEDVEALFHHDPAEEGDDHLIVGDA